MPATSSTHSPIPFGASATKVGEEVQQNRRFGLTHIPAYLTHTVAPCFRVGVHPSRSFQSTAEAAS